MYSNTNLIKDKVIAGDSTFSGSYLTMVNFCFNYEKEMMKNDLK